MTHVSYCTVTVLTILTHILVEEAYTRNKGKAGTNFKSTPSPQYIELILQQAQQLNQSS
jgi:hypothetical protein